MPNLKFLTAGSPAYWSSDPNKIAYIIDFAVNTCIDADFQAIINNEDMNSDHFALIFNMNMPVFVTYCKQCILSKSSNINFIYTSGCIL